MKTRLRSIKNAIVKHAPAILSALACVGVVVTAGVAANDGVKAHKKLNEKREEKGEGLTVVEQVTTAAPCYIPTVISAGMTMGCIIASHKISSDRLLAMTSAYTTLSNQFKEYRQKVTEEYGEEQEQEVRKAIVEDHMNSGIPAASEREMIFVEPITGKEFRSTMNAVKQAEADLNRMLIQDGTVCVNEWLDLLGLGQYKKKEYDMMGWSQDFEDCAEFFLYNNGYIWVDFEHTLTTNHNQKLRGKEVCEISCTSPLEFDPDQFMYEYPVTTGNAIKTITGMVDKVIKEVK